MRDAKGMLQGSRQTSQYLPSRHSAHRKSTGVAHTESLSQRQYIDGCLPRGPPELYNDTSDSDVKVTSGMLPSPPERRNVRMNPLLNPVLAAISRLRFPPKDAWH